MPFMFEYLEFEYVSDLLKIFLYLTSLAKL